MCDWADLLVVNRRRWFGSVEDLTEGMGWYGMGWALGKCQWNPATGLDFYLGRKQRFMWTELVTDERGERGRRAGWRSK